MFLMFLRFLTSLSSQVEKRRASRMLEDVGTQLGRKKVSYEALMGNSQEDSSISLNMVEYGIHGRS